MDSHSVNKGPVRTQIPANEQKPTSNSHSDDTFNTFVESPNDMRGMIAYCIYRFQKQQEFKDKSVSDQEKTDFGRLCVTGRKYDSIKDQASEIVGIFTDRVIKNHSKDKFWHDCRVGIVTGVVTALLSPFAWYVMKAVIISSGAAAQAEEIIKDVTSKGDEVNPSSTAP